MLVGMMGSGKTTLGRALAEQLRRPFVDSDEQVAARTGRTVREIFEHEGEPAFRRLEAEALAEAVSSSQPSVIAAAGGVVLDAENRRRLREAGTVVWLRAPAGVLAERAAGADHRPLLGDDPGEAMARLAAEREPLYAEVADAALDVAGLDVDAALERICALLPEETRP